MKRRGVCGQESRQRQPATDAVRRAASVLQLAAGILVGVMLWLGLPAAAQHSCLEGRVQQAGPHQATLAVYVTAPTPDAPGKVPEQYAAQAATLEDQAQQLEQQGKSGLARQVRMKVRQLRCQREVEFTVREHDPLMMVSIGAAALKMADKGMHLTVDVSASGPTQPAPHRVTLMKAARQVTAREPLGLRALPRGPNDPKSYFKLTGVVLRTDPVTLGINGQEFTVEDPRNLGFSRQTRITVSELPASRPILVWAHVGADTRIQQVSRLVVFTSASEIPYEQIADLEL